MRAFALSLAATLLVSCTASIPVHQMPEGKAASLKKEGTLLVLPRTELTLTYDQIKTTYSPGRWTEELLACKNTYGVFAQMTARDFAGRIADTNVPQTCLDFYRLGVDADRYEDDKQQACAGDDSQKGWTRHGIDSQSFKVSSAPVRDPKNVYWVETPIRWLGSVDVTVKYGPAGTVDGAKTIATNAWSDFAAKALGAVISGGVPAGGGGSAPAIAGVPSRNSCAEQRPSVCAAIQKDLKDLEEYNKKPATLAATAQGPSFDKQLELLSSAIDAQRALFEGTLSKKAEAQRTIWIPGELSDKDQLCKPAAIAGDDPVCVPGQRQWLSNKVWLCGNDARKDSPAHQDRSRRVALEAWRDDDTKLVETLAAMAQQSENGFASGTAENRGLPYRIVPRTRIKTVTENCTYKAGEPCTSSSKPIDAVYPIPQFGWVGRLAPKAGGRKATFDVDYNVDTGELVSVQVAGEGSDASPIQDALFSRLKEDKKPTELETLKAEQERVTALKAICEAYAALKAEKPAFCI